MRGGLPLGLAASLALAGAAAAQPLVLPGDPASRREARARLEALSLNLQSWPSATTVLRIWCEDYGLAPEPQIRAIRVRGVDKPLAPEDRALLGAAPGEAVRYRRVRLACGERVLSEADNWYRPGLLTDEMNQALETTDAPFGAVVAPLRFQRRTLATRKLFRPPEPPRRNRWRDVPMAVPPFVLEHRALLLTREGAPLSLVVESYTGQVLAGQLRPGADAAEAPSAETAAP
jgi:hypothetical protein